MFAFEDACKSSTLASSEHRVYSFAELSEPLTLGVGQALPALAVAASAAAASIARSSASAR